MDVPLFGDAPNKRRRQINLGGAHTATTHNDILQEAKLRRIQRDDHRRRQDAARRIQHSWRGYAARRDVRTRLRSTFEQDITSLTGLRCLVLLGQDEEALGRWSTVVLSSRQGALQDALPLLFLTPLQIYWHDQIRVRSCCCSESVACSSSLSPRIPSAYHILYKYAHAHVLTSSPHVQAHLGVLNVLLSDHPARADITRYLVSHGFYPDLRHAVLQIVSGTFSYSQPRITSRSPACPSSQAVSHTLPARHTPRVATVHTRSPPSLPARAPPLHPHDPLASEPSAACFGSVFCTTTARFTRPCATRYHQRSRAVIHRV